MKAALYVRVSTARKVKDDRDQFVQNPEVQAAPLLKLAAARDLEVHRLYSDRLSGANNRRPAFLDLLADARRGLFEVVIVWRFDRFARSARDLVNALDEFRSLGIDFVSHQEALDTSTPMGRATFTIIAAIAELERNIIQERIRSGLDHAREKGTKSGRPIGRPASIIDGNKVLELRAAGMSFREIASDLGSSFYKVRQTYLRLETMTAGGSKEH